MLQIGDFGQTSVLLLNRPTDGILPAMLKVIAALILPIAGLAYFTVRPQTDTDQTQRIEYSNRRTEALRASNAGQRVKACELYKALLRDGIPMDQNETSFLERDCR